MLLKAEKDQKRGIYLYVLELQEGKYYVGITNKPVSRINKHMKGISSSTFTKKYLPIISVEKFKLVTRKRLIAEIIENNKTIELVKLYGIENVSGGQIVGDL